MELIQQLINNLGVNEDQAKGGAGLLFQLAKDKLGGDDFSQLTDAVPGIEDMIGSAPEASGGVMGALGGLASSFGVDSLGNLASLAGGFDKLGLDSGMITKFVPQVLEFVKAQGGEGVMGILQSVLGGK